MDMRDSDTYKNQGKEIKYSDNSRLTKQWSRINILKAIIRETFPKRLELSYSQGTSSCTLKTAQNIQQEHMSY